VEETGLYNEGEGDEAVRAIVHRQAHPNKITCSFRD